MHLDKAMSVIIIRAKSTIELYYISDVGILISKVRSAYLLWIKAVRLVEAEYCFLLLLRLYSPIVCLRCSALLCSIESVLFLQSSSMVCRNSLSLMLGFVLFLIVLRSVFKCSIGS